MRAILYADFRFKNLASYLFETAKTGLKDGRPSFKLTQIMQ